MERNCFLFVELSELLLFTKQVYLLHFFKFVHARHERTVHISI